MSELVLVPPEEQERADVYGLLAALLLEPDAALLAAVATMSPAGADCPLAPQWNELLLAAACGPAQLRVEYEALFIDAGTPPLNPYQCYYRAGCLMDKPLAQLRHDLRQLGLARAPGVTELEDHLGALCETMRVLIEAGRPAELQRDFFARHVAGWSATCLQDIAGAPGASFYRALAAFAQAFLALEAQALGLEEASAEPKPQRTPSPHVAATS